jgi:hypothetical protein
MFCIINLVNSQVYRVEKVGIYLLYPSKKSIFSFFGVSFKKSYLNTDFRFFWANDYTKHFQKQHISNQLNQGFRLVYEFAYLYLKKIGLLDHKGGPLPKKIDFFFF